MSETGDSGDGPSSTELLSSSGSTAVAVVSSSAVSSNNSSSSIVSTTAAMNLRTLSSAHQEMGNLIQEGKKKSCELALTLKSIEHQTSRMQHQFSKATSEINETYQFCLSLLDEMKSETLKELDDQYNSRLISLTLASSKIQEHIDKLDQLDHFTDCFRKFQPNDLMQFKQLIEQRLRAMISYDPEIGKPANTDLEFVSNFQTIRSSLRNSFGYIRCSQSGQLQLQDGSPTNTTPGHHHAHHQQQLQHQASSHHPMTIGLTKQPPISRPNGSINSMNGINSSASGPAPGIITNGHSSLSSFPHQNGYDSILKTTTTSSRFPGANNSNTSIILGANGSSNNSSSSSNSSNSSSTSSVSGSAAISSLSDSANANRHPSFSSTSSNGLENITNLYEKWSIGGNGSPDSSLFSNGTSALLEHLNNGSSPFPPSDPLIDLSGKLMNGSAAPILPIKSQIKRQKMIYHCKFGEFGVMEGQFTEPSGVAVNAQNDIIVADTNNHRIQIFDKEGRFKFQFGECGKRDGQLLYPNRVAVVKQSGDIIVTERSPTHQIQIYNQYGQFVRKFGANILQHPRGVTVDNKGRIIVVECKVMRVLIFDQSGNVLQKFGCSKHLEFPNGVVVNDKQEIFISDNRAHCVKVFSYEGHFLRQIGGEGLTNYPIGVCINDAGEILVADNHNNFNITIFTQDGQLISALESKVKHAQCFDVALMDDNSVVLASKDYRIYIYRYLQLQSIAQAVAASGLC